MSHCRLLNKGPLLNVLLAKMRSYTVVLCYNFFYIIIFFVAEQVACPHEKCWGVTTLILHVRSTNEEHVLAGADAH